MSAVDDEEGSTTPTGASEGVGGDVMRWGREEVKGWLLKEGLGEFVDVIGAANGVDLLVMTKAEVELACSRGEGGHVLPSLTPHRNYEVLWAALQRLRVTRGSEIQRYKPEVPGSPLRHQALPPAAPLASCLAANSYLITSIRHIAIVVLAVLFLVAVQTNPVRWKHLGSIRLESEEEESIFKGSIASLVTSHTMYLAVNDVADYVQVKLFIPPLELQGKLSATTNVTVRMTVEALNGTKWVDSDVTEIRADFEKAVAETKRLKGGPDAVRVAVELLVSPFERMTIPIKYRVRGQPGIAPYGSLFGFLALVIMYVLIIFDVTPKVIAAMISSFAVLALYSYIDQTPHLSEVVSWIDFETICLLFGMMIIIGYISETGFFEWIAVRLYMMSRGSPWYLVLLLSVFTAVLSALLDNVTTILLIGPVTIKLCAVLDFPATPILISEVLFSNIGGALTPIGDPPNVIIANNKDVVHSGITFMGFIGGMAIGVGLCLMVAVGVMKKTVKPAVMSAIPSNEMLRKEISLSTRYVEVMDPGLKALKAVTLQRIAALEHELSGLTTSQTAGSVPTARPTPSQLIDRYPITNIPLLCQSGCVLTTVIVLFFLHGAIQLRLSLAMISLLGAVTLIALVNSKSLDSIMQKVEWETLLFFASLFVLMRGLEELGLIDDVAEATADIIESVPSGGRTTVAVIIVLWVSALASAFIDNIPYTAAMVPVIVKLSQNPNTQVPLQPLVFALSFGTCLGGNGTLIGASCNVVAAGLLQQQGTPLTFWAFFRLAMPVMLLTTSAAMLYLIIVAQFY